MKQTNTILKIVVICVICAVTLMAGCLDSEESIDNETNIERCEQYGPRIDNQYDDFIGHHQEIPPAIATTPLVTTIIPQHLPDNEYSIYQRSGKDVYVCSHYGCDMADSLINSGYTAGVVVDHADNHILTWLKLDGIRYVIEPQTGEYWVSNMYEPKHNIDYVSLSKGREHAKASSEGLHT